MSAIKGLLFDKDGTLIDFHATWMAPMRDLAVELCSGDAEAAEALLQMAGYDPASGRVTGDSLLAAGHSDELALLWQPHVPHFSTAEIVQAIDANALLVATQTSQPVLPLAPFFDRLRARGLALGLATSDSEDGARTLLEREGVTLDFVSGYDSGHGAKTGPGMALAFAERVGLPPESLAVVGDNLIDLMMGRQAGYGAGIAVLTGTGEASSLKVFADAVLPSIEHLEAWLDGR
ncbi:MAG: HAD family hydrolase [Pseudomonadota bacterium]